MQSSWIQILRLEHTGIWFQAQMFQILYAYGSGSGSGSKFLLDLKRGSISTLFGTGEFGYLDNWIPFCNPKSNVDRNRACCSLWGELRSAVLHIYILDCYGHVA